jgi:hypothetical protein
VRHLTRRSPACSQVGRAASRSPAPTHSTRGFESWLGLQSTKFEVAVCCLFCFVLFCFVCWWPLLLFAFDW